MNKEEKKCETFIDHDPQWAGDGYFCSKCMIRFVPEKSQRKEIIEKIDKLETYQGWSGDKLISKDEIIDLIKNEK